MTATSLVKLEIAHLRGAVQPFELPFDQGKKLTMIYGENGTGKSTICDALEFLGNGRVGSLDNRGLGSTNRYWHSVGSSPADVAVTLTTTASSWEAHLARGDVVVYPLDDRPRVEVLRRAQILALIEATPAERYKAISRFIDVTTIENSEKSLRGLIKELNDRLNEATSQIRHDQDAIDHFWVEAGRPGHEAMAWASAQARRPPDAPDPELDALRRLRAAYARLIDHPERLADAEDAVLRAGEAAAAAQQQAADHLQAIAHDAGEVIDFLATAQAYFRAHGNVAVCPVCERPDGAAGLAGRIDRRLEAFASLQQSQSSRTAAAQQVQRAQHQRDLVRKQARDDAAAFEEARARFGWSADVPLPAIPAPSDPEGLAAWLTATATLPGAWEQAETIRQDRGMFLATLKRMYTTLTNNLEDHQETGHLLPRLQQALDIIEQERKAFTDEILQSIAGEVGRLYEAVHPGEGLDKIRLELNARKRASLEMAASFGGQNDTPPQAYFSQSHLETLGLCVFLALNTLDDPANTILVFDDVLASVDEPHVERVIEMVYQEATRFRHCIITTHNGLWKRNLRQEWLTAHQCQFIELSRWTATGGMSLLRGAPEGRQV